MPTCDGSCRDENGWTCYGCQEKASFARALAIQARVDHQMGLCGGRRRGCQFCAASRTK